jgi:hypothetical protein
MPKRSLALKAVERARDADVEIHDWNVLTVFGYLMEKYESYCEERYPTYRLRNEFHSMEDRLEEDGPETTVRGIDALFGGSQELQWIDRPTSAWILDDNKWQRVLGAMEQGRKKRSRGAKSRAEYRGRKGKTKRKF